ncbi:hypothetical protein EBT16_01405 [bacterium]|nr:hypothetical protein [bacterium]
MSNFKVNEIKSWAKSHGIAFKKQGKGYVWAKEGCSFDSPPEDIDSAVKSIFNEITSGKFKEHQKNYKAAP